MIGTGIGAYLLGKNSKRSVSEVIDTSEVTPTEGVKATPTQSISPTTGFITGSMSFPSEVIPEDVEVCAQNALTENEYCTQERINSPEYTYRVGYKLEVPVGSYLVFSKRPGDSYKAYFSEFVTCGLKATCKSHEPIVVSVSSGQTAENIDPGDWYNIPTPTPTP